MERGEVWWASTPPPSTSEGGPRRHLVVLLSWDAGLGIRDRVTVAPITTRIRGLDAEVLLDHNDGVSEACVVNCDIIVTVLRSTLARRQGCLSDGRMREVERAIHKALGIELPCLIV